MTSKRKARPGDLRSHHRSELFRSGIKVSTALRAGLYSESRPDTLRELLGRTPGFKGAALVFPYPDSTGRMNGYARLRPDNPRRDGEGKQVKYEAPSEQPPRLYVPPGTVAALADSTISLLITEGEKKALAADQAGLKCVAVSGVWAWQKRRDRNENGKPRGKRKLIDDLASIPMEGRKIYIAFDSDLAEKPDIQHAEQELAKALSANGATVRCIRLPPGPNGTKVGLDDYLITHSTRELRTLLKKSVDPMQVIPKPSGTEILNVGDGGIPCKNVRPRTIEQAMKVFRKHLHISDPTLLEVVLGVAATIHLPGDPLWMIVVDASGSGKTEYLRVLLDHPEAIFISTLTTSSLISGFEDETHADQSLLPKLNGKLLVIKDLTPILTANSDRRMELLGQLRDAYDGQSARAFGVGGIKEYRSIFALLAGCTPVIEQHSAAMQPLGERFLRFQPKPGKLTDKIERALQNANQEPNIRHELAEAAQGVLAGASKRPPKLCRRAHGLLVGLSNLLAVARTEVPRNGYTKEITAIPLPEVGGRVGKQLLRLMQGVAMIHRRRSIGPHEFSIAQRVAFDCLPSKRRCILRALHNVKDGIAADDLAKQLRLPKATVKLAIQDMELLGLVETKINTKTTNRGNTVEVLSYHLVVEHRKVMDEIKRYTGADI